VIRIRPRASSGQAGETLAFRIRQLSLPLDAERAEEPTVRSAWARSRIDLPFEIAMRSRALAICLRNYAESLGTRRERRVH